MHSGGSHGPSDHGWHQNPSGFGKKKGHYPTGFGWQNLSNHVGNQGLHKYWSFQTEHKVFMITLSEDGGAVRVCERTRLFEVEVSVTIDAVAWIIDTLQELQRKNGMLKSGLKRSFRNSLASYFLECFSNRKGEFLKISTLRNNKIKAVIIPEEDGAKGWTDFIWCLNGVMGRKVEIQQACPRQHRNEKAVRNVTNKQTWANIVKNSLKNAPKHDQRKRDCKETEQGKLEGNKVPIKFPNWKLKGLGSWDFLPKANGSFRPKNDFPIRRLKQKKFHEYMQAKQCEKDWKKAIIMFRDNSRLSWSCIFYNLSRELGRKLQVSQMFDDQVIIWCEDETEMERFLRKGNWNIPGTGDTRVFFKRWSTEEQNRDIKVECRGSWIGVKGIPLNVWNMKLFRKIGALCGGLLDVEKVTAKMNFLHHVRIKLEGDSNGFVPESLKLDFEKSVFKLELFKLNDMRYRFSGFFNTCWHQDFEIGQRIEDEGEMNGGTNSKGVSGDLEPGHHEEVEEEGRTKESGRVSGCEKEGVAFSPDFETETEVEAGSDEIHGGVDSEVHHEVDTWDSKGDDRFIEAVTNVPEKYSESESECTAPPMVVVNGAHPGKQLLEIKDSGLTEDECCRMFIVTRRGELPNKKKFMKNGLVDIKRIFSRIFLDLSYVDRSPNMRLLISPNDTWFSKNRGGSFFQRPNTDCLSKLLMGLTRPSPLKLSCAYGPASVDTLWLESNGPVKVYLDPEDRLKPLLLNSRPNFLCELLRCSNMEKDLSRKENTKQVINEIMNCHLRTVKAKNRNDFRLAIILSWKDFEIHAKKAKISVLQMAEVEEKDDPRVSKRMTKGFENQFSLEEEVGNDFIDEESQVMSSNSENSEEEITDAEEDNAETEEDIICDLNGLWKEEFQVQTQTVETSNDNREAKIDQEEWNSLTGSNSPFNFQNLRRTPLTPQRLTPQFSASPIEAYASLLLNKAHALVSTRADALAAEEAEELPAAAAAGVPTRFFASIPSKFELKQGEETERKLLQRLMLPLGNICDQQIDMFIVIVIVSVVAYEHIRGIDIFMGSVDRVVISNTTKKLVH
ncbi:hypothetical protein G4B88_007389 [Cannabis sativa]|uniref:DUF4283 domain-containing protein n=1 Tax=Cannabis sativa TaxID=3483 RepID=A0A7J6DRC1_CANSA|nr:hypothetical protein G4B88_007389 [Cannabis sativa]